LGQLTKIRIRQDDSGLIDSCWHLEYVKIDDTKTGQTYMFPCCKWLSSKKDDRQIVREILCSNNSSNTNRRDKKVLYEMEVVTSARLNSGTTHNGWIIIEGNKNKSDRLPLKNTPQNRIFQE
jgi:hypothetical protein